MERLVAVALLITSWPIVLMARGVSLLCGCRLRARRQTCIGRDGKPIEIHAVEVRSPGTGARRALCEIMGSTLRRWLALTDVAAGTLGFVGPRARSAGEASALASTANILAVKPGLISLWGVRSRTHIGYDTEEQADVEYLATRSFKTDLGILARRVLTAIYGATDRHVPAMTSFFGVRHLNLAMAEVLDMLAIALCQRKRVRIAFVNPDCVNLSERNPVYKSDLASFDWVLTDGIGMIIAGRLLGQPVRQNVNGTDLFPRLCQLLEETGHPLYLLGGRPGVAEGVVSWVRNRHPGVRIAGFHHGYFSPQEEGAIISEIIASGTAVLLVGLGAPHQERWITDHGDECGALLTIGVGGLFDFYSGRIPRAPQWVRELGCEWIYRLIQEPRRLWKRYLVGNAVFLSRVLKTRVTQHGEVINESRQ